MSPEPLIFPADEYNHLIQYVHPLDWENPTPDVAIT